MVTQVVVQVVLLKSAYPEIKIVKRFAMKKSFTLIELLIVVAILGVISAIGIPMYNGYVQTSKESVAQNNLRAISLLEADYHTENNKYFLTLTGDQTRTINNLLFSGKKMLDEKGVYYYFIQPFGSSGYRAFAYPHQGPHRYFCIDHNNKLNKAC